MDISPPSLSQSDKGSVSKFHLSSFVAPELALRDVS
jgi:hypothetical protein